MNNTERAVIKSAVKHGGWGIISPLLLRIKKLSVEMEQAVQAGDFEKAIAAAQQARRAYLGIPRTRTTEQILKGVLMALLTNPASYSMAAQAPDDADTVRRAQVVARTTARYMRETVSQLAQFFIKLKGQAAS